MKSSTYVRVLAILWALGFGIASAQAITYTIIDHPSADVYGTQLTSVDGGNVVGNYFPNDHSIGFLYNGSTYTTIRDPNEVYGTFVEGISGNTVVGYYHDSNNNYHGFIYNTATTQYTTLNDPSGTNSTELTGVQGNLIVGWSDARSFIYDGSKFTALAGSSGHNRIRADCISGTTVGGYMFDTGTINTHAFLYNTATKSYSLIDGPTGSYPRIFGISGSRFVGYYGDQAAGSNEGFFSDGTTLTSIYSPLSKYHETEAYGISGNTVVGQLYSDSANPIGRGFIAVLPEPGTITLFVMGALGVWFASRRRPKLS